jgi:hypothetical protein
MPSILVQTSFCIVSGELVGKDCGLPVVVAVDVGVGLEVANDVAVGEGLAVWHVGCVMVSVSVDTVPPKAKARPIQVMLLPILIPESSMFVPANVELAARVVASPGVQKTLHSEAPFERETLELATVVKAPVDLKM